MFGPIPDLWVPTAVVQPTETANIFAKRPFPATEVDNNDGDKVEQEPATTKPKPKRKRPSPKPLVNPAPSKPGEVQFPAGLPHNLTNMFREWMRAQNTNVVPFDIYYMQVPWVFKCHDAPTKKNATDAAYYHAISNQELSVQMFSLPWMLYEPSGRNSQRLLVASGGPLPEPSVLCRIKRGSSEFRIWRGVYDNPFEQPTVVKKPRLPGEQPIANEPYGTAVTSSIVSPAILAPGKRKRTVTPNSDYLELVDGQDENEYADEEVYGNMIMPTVQDSLRSTSTESDPRILENKAQDIIFRFQGQQIRQRVRNLVQTSNFHMLITQAIAGGVLVANDPVRVLKCDWSVVDSGAGEKLVVDEQDFEELLWEIAGDPGWMFPDAVCCIDVTRQIW